MLFDVKVLHPLKSNYEPLQELDRAYLTKITSEKARSKLYVFNEYPSVLQWKIDLNGH